MPFSFLVKRPREALTTQAARARGFAINRVVAVILVVLYNVVGAVDIVSTHHGVGSGVAEEVNPIMRAGMEHLGLGWIAAKLFLQGVITGMVLWFPHRIVL
ncbi:MAG: DUF5658 family protein, partial [Parvularculaceae bacterium]|nr:DUF5658 family protein [Parvularculaceae bacterium]